MAETMRVAEPVLEEREFARAGIETVQAMRRRCQPQHTAWFFGHRVILSQTSLPGAISLELLGPRIEPVQSKVRRDPQGSFPIDPQSSDIVVTQRSRIRWDVSISFVPPGTRIEAYQTVASCPEPQISTAVLRNGAHTAAEHRLRQNA